MMAVVGIVVHAIFDRPSLPGALNLVDTAGPPTVATRWRPAGRSGWSLSLLLFKLKLIPISFPKGEPILEVERPALEEEIRQAKEEGRVLDYQGDLPPPYTKREIRAEIRKEILFLLPPMTLAVLWMLLTTRVPPRRPGLDRGHRVAATSTASSGPSSGRCRRVGRLGRAHPRHARLRPRRDGPRRRPPDVRRRRGHRGRAVGRRVLPRAVLRHRAGACTCCCTGKHRELPYGPYLSLGTAAVMLFYCPIADYLRPGLTAMIYFLNGMVNGGGGGA